MSCNNVEDYQDMILEQALEYIRMMGYEIIEAYKYVTLEKEGKRFHIPFSDAIECYKMETLPEDYAE